MSTWFETEEPWSVNDSTILPAGDHVVHVASIESGYSRNGYPQIELEVGNKDGTLRDWLVITPRTRGKIVQFVNALGASYPTAADIGADDGLSQEYLDKLKGLSCKILARDEPKMNNPEQMITRIKAYAPAGDQSDQSNGSQQSQPADDALPF
jgi:hypothetical protein